MGTPDIREETELREMTNSELAEKFFDELEEAIRRERPIRLVYAGNVTSVEDLKCMWENGALCL
jgi:hypothetical protein